MWQVILNAEYQATIGINLSVLGNVVEGRKVCYANSVALSEPRWTGRSPSVEIGSGCSGSPELGGLSPRARVCMVDCGTVIQGKVGIPEVANSCHRFCYNSTAGNLYPPSISFMPLARMHVGFQARHCSGTALPTYGTLESSEN